MIKPLQDIFLNCNIPFVLIFSELSKPDHVTYHDWSHDREILSQSHPQHLVLIFIHIVPTSLYLW